MSIYINQNKTGFPFIGIIFFVLFFIALFYLAKGLFFILSWLTPVLVVLTALINYRVFIDFGRTIKNTFQRNILLGIATLGLCVLAFPFVAAYLFFKALVTRKIKSLQSEVEKRREGEFVDYEIVEDDVHIELPQLDVTEEKAENDYKQFFNE